MISLSLHEHKFSVFAYAIYRNLFDFSSLMVDVARSSQVLKFFTKQSLKTCTCALFSLRGFSPFGRIKVFRRNFFKTTTGFRRRYQHALSVTSAPRWIIFATIHFRVNKATFSSDSDKRKKKKWFPFSFLRKLRRNIFCSPYFAPQTKFKC